ncbi:DUF6053 domain-containing protein [Lysobacter capsici]|uniref:DUF6053 domain-containing protein n=1 Tax=Lysobacter capsici TaxID=435897 RepID=UPI003D2F9950
MGRASAGHAGLRKRSFACVGGASAPTLFAQVAVLWSKALSAWRSERTASGLKPLPQSSWPSWTPESSAAFFHAAYNPGRPGHGSAQAGIRISPSSQRTMFG